MFQPKTYAELCNAMQTGAVVEIEGAVGFINGIQREDGSGRNWIVTITPNGIILPKDIRKFVRTA